MFCTWPWGNELFKGECFVPGPEGMSSLKVSVLYLALVGELFKGECFVPGPGGGAL